MAHRFRTWTSGLLVVGVFCLAWALPSGPALGQGTSTFVVTPDHGPPGTPVVVQDVTPCIAPPGATNWDAFVTITYPSRFNDSPPSEQFTTPVALDGLWQWSFVPGIGGLPRPGDAAISASCVDDQGDHVDYAPENFDVTTSGQGYWLATSDPIVAPCVCLSSTNIGALGDAVWHGPVPGSPVVGVTANPATGNGYWVVGADGGVFAYGDAAFRGSVPAMDPTAHVADVVGMAATSDGNGYWLVGADGGVFAFGDAGFYGSLPGHRIVVNDVVGIASTPDGKGYWLVSHDGGVFSFGDAGFHGSLPGQGVAVNDIVGVARTPSGGGYWLAGADGGVFALGDAPFKGSMASTHLDAPVVGIAASGSGRGYWLAASDGGVFALGDAPFEGSYADLGYFFEGSSAPIPEHGYVGIAATPSTK